MFQFLSFAQYLSNINELLMLKFDFEGMAVKLLDAMFNEKSSAQLLHKKGVASLDEDS